MNAEKGGWLARLKKGLERTRVNIVGVFSGGVIDDALFDDLEVALLGADCGAATTSDLLAALRDRIKLQGLKTPAEVRDALRDELARLLAPCEATIALDRARPLVAVWGQRNGVEVIAQKSGDPAAVVFDAVAAARARGIDVLIADTAGPTC